MKWVTTPAALAAAIGAFFMSIVLTASPASAAMNQASTAFYDAVGTSIYHIPIYRGTFTIVPKGSGHHLTTLRWQNTNSSNVCAQKVDFTALDVHKKTVWTSPGAGVYGCRHDYTANRGVDLSTDGVSKICGTLYFLGYTDPDGTEHWNRKVTTCSIM
jgi:hypothetical protein